jgi:hypothetical protein
MSVNATPGDRNKNVQTFLFILFGFCAFLALVSTGAVYWYTKSRKPVGEAVAKKATVATNQQILKAEDFAPTNSVTIELGEDESRGGLTHVDRERDGATSIESIDGVQARVLRLSDNRTKLFFYFRIDLSFKQQDLRRVRFDVEYLDPEPGSLNIHYDALDESNPRDPAYKSTSSVRMTGSKQWHNATFRSREDALFSNRQNGRSDFRIAATAPILYVRRVTVTRELAPEEGWPTDFSASNQVSIVLGKETPSDGLRHLFDQSDGRTMVTNLNGVVCRSLNRTLEGKGWGFLYFEISPSFKRTGLANARVEIEYFTPRQNYFRLQFDGIENGTNRIYLPAMPLGARVMKWRTGLEQAQIPTVGAWATATFPITNAIFRNSQNGGADFRFEVASPAEIFVRRVTVTREDAQAVRPPSPLNAN